MSYLRKQGKNLEGYLYIMPAFMLVLVFGIFPIFYTMFVSLHRWRIKKGDFVGLANFTRIFGEGPWLWFLLAGLAMLILAMWLREKALEDHRNHSKLIHGSPLSAMNNIERIFLFLSYLAFAGGISLLVFSLPNLWANGDDDMFDSLRITIWYSLGAIPVQLAGGLFIAWLLKNKFKGQQAYRVIILLPYIVPIVAGAAVFERLFSIRPESFANQVLAALGAQPLEWLREPRGIFELIFGFGKGESGGLIAQYWRQWATGPSLALVSILFFNYWIFTGYYALIYANGLSQIPKELYEAAEVDGAPKRVVFFRVVLPLLTPTTYFLTLMGIIGTFKSFSHIWVLRNNFSGRAADPLSIYIFNIFYSRSRFGYASALSLILMAIVLLLTVFQNKIMKSRMYYGD